MRADVKTSFPHFEYSNTTSFTGQNGWLLSLNPAFSSRRNGITRRLHEKRAMKFARRTLSKRIRACLKIPSGAVFEQKAGWRGATKENTPCGSSTEEQRSQTAFCSKTLRAVGLLALTRVGSVVTARSGDAPTSPPWPNPKCLAAAPPAIFRQALRNKFL